jgi:hypothetical protein
MTQTGNRARRKMGRRRTAKYSVSQKDCVALIRCRLGETRLPPNQYREFHIETSTNSRSNLRAHCAAFDIATLRTQELSKLVQCPAVFRDSAIKRRSLQLRRCKRLIADRSDAPHFAASRWSRSVAQSEAGPDVTEGGDQCLDVLVAVQWRRRQTQPFGAAWDRRIIDRLDVDPVAMQ